jgi:hypothetical protein
VSVVRSTSSDYLLGGKFSDSELIIGLVGAVGTELKQVIGILVERLKVFGYTAEEVRVSSDIIPQLVKNDDDPEEGSPEAEYRRIKGMMDAGNTARKNAADNSVLALGVAARISAGRPKDEEGNGDPKVRRRHAYIVNSLKHPDEVARLRDIYPEAFYLIGVHADEKRRKGYLVERMSEPHAVELMQVAAAAQPQR